MASVTSAASERGASPADALPTHVSPWDRRDPTAQRILLTLTVCTLTILLPLGPNRFMLAGLIVIVQTVTTIVINRTTKRPVQRLGAFLVVEHSLAVIATLLVPTAYLGANVITIGSLGANAAYLPPKWLRLLGAVSATNTVAAPLVSDVQQAPLIISLGLFLILHTVLNRSGDVLVAEAIAKGAQWQADHDALTGLPNRRVLRTRLGELDSDAHAGLLLVDMNNFKEINDTLGHDFGDDVLRVVAERMSSIDDSILVVRLGGDEFAAVVPGDRAATQQFADRLADAWRRPVMVRGVEIAARGAIGMAHSDSVAVMDLLRFADVAMYSAKSGGEASTWYDAADDPHSRRRLQLVQEVPSALISGAVRPWYQSQFDIMTGEPVGVEALARWHHDDLGVIGAAELLELVALTGQHTKLTEAIFVKAVAEGATWPEHIRLSVNVTSSDLSSPGLVEIMLATLERFRFDPGRITLEITENDNEITSATALTHLALLRETGMSISLDDFGRAYSTMARLDQLDADELKIDRHFVGNIVHRPSSRAAVDSMVGMAHRLDLRVVAQGVEDEATALALSEAGVRIAQGPLYARPSKSAALVSTANTPPSGMSIANVIATGERQ